MQQRPTGVTILAILAAIGGVFSIMGGLTIAAFGGLAGAANGSPDLGALVFVFGGVMVILGGIAIALAIGFWGAMPWAWPLGVLLALAEIGWQIAQLVVVRDVFSAVITGAIWAVILYYLNQPNVKRYFGR